MTHPIFWSFRRCPYAMRARLAIASADIRVELREVVLRDKPAQFLETSPSATVPCLKNGSEVLDESLDIMVWALKTRDPDGWLEMPGEGVRLIAECDGPFKTALDRYKYASRYEDVNSIEERETAAVFLRELDEMLSGNDWLFGADPKLADMAILPFVRQYAHVDMDWFGAQPWPDLIRWLEAFKASERFAEIMAKYPQWQPGHTPVLFPENPCL